MANLLNSPLRRARLSVALWLDILPKDAQIDAQMALDRLVDLAEKEVEQAFHAGQDFNRDGRRASEAAAQPKS